jgi:hypothetical protein
MELSPALLNAVGTQLFPRSKNYPEPKMKNAPAKPGRLKV